jgi:hypothetical protein
MYFGQAHLFGKGIASTPVCKRDTNLLDAPASDWMEWQAGYACGSFLMPRSFACKKAQVVLDEFGHFGPVDIASPVGKALINAMKIGFQVSADAARIRLLKLNILGRERGPSLFSKS